MAAGKEIRGKIKSVENTKKITKAMEMVAASKMRKAQDRMRAARPYAEKVRQDKEHLFVRIGVHPLLTGTRAIRPNLDHPLSLTYGAKGFRIPIDTHPHQLRGVAVRSRFAVRPITGTVGHTQLRGVVDEPLIGLGLSHSREKHRDARQQASAPDPGEKDM